MISLESIVVIIALSSVATKHSSIFIRSNTLRKRKTRQNTLNSAIKKGASSVWHIFELSEWVSLALPINQNSNSHAHCTYCNSLGFMLHQNELRTQLESKNLKPQTSSSTNYILQHVVYEDNTITTVRNERGLFTLRKMGENAIHNKCQTLSNNTRTNNDEPNLSQSPLSSCKTLFCIRR